MSVDGYFLSCANPEHEHLRITAAFCQSPFRPWRTGSQNRAHRILVGGGVQIFAEELIEFHDDLFCYESVLLFFRFFLAAAPVIGVIFHHGNAEVLQQEIPVGVRQCGTKALGGVALLADEHPRGPQLSHSDRRCLPRCRSSRR